LCYLRFVAIEAAIQPCGIEPGRKSKRRTPKVQNPKFDDQKPESPPREHESTIPDPKVQNPRFDDQKPESTPQGHESAAPDQKVQNPRFDDQKCVPVPQGEESAAASQKCRNQNLLTKNRRSRAEAKEGQPPAADVQNPKFDDQNVLARFARLRSQILERKELIARDGNIAETWRTHRGKRTGPYYRVAFRENGRQRAFYIGGDAQLAKMVMELIGELKHPREEKRLIRRLRAAARASLRRTLAEAEALAAPLGFRRRGFRFCKRR
jgi:hypothetical protein